MTPIYSCVRPFQSFVSLLCEPNQQSNQQSPGESTQKQDNKYFEISGYISRLLSVIAGSETFLALMKYRISVL